MPFLCISWPKQSYTGSLYTMHDRIPCSGTGRTPCVDSSAIRMIIANCCLSDKGTERDPAPGVLDMFWCPMIGDPSKLMLPRLRLLGVLRSGINNFFPIQSTVSISFSTLYNTITTFNDSKEEGFEKYSGKRRKWRLPAFFFFSNGISYSNIEWNHNLRNV